MRISDRSSDVCSSDLLPRRVKAGKIGASGKVDQHAAAGVMRGGDDRDRLPGDVDAKIEQPLVNGGKMPGDKIGRLVADVDVHEIKAEALDLMVDREGDEVEPRQLSPRIENGPAATAIGRTIQYRTFSAHRLGNEDRTEKRRDRKNETAKGRTEW